MKWIEEIITKHVDEEGKLDVTKAIDEVTTEAPKHTIPKAVFNQTSDDLKAANQLVEDLKKENKDIEDLQSKITQYEEDIEKIQAERLGEKKNFTLKERLNAAGAKDVDYLIYKLGEVETDEEGNIKDVDNKIKDLQVEYETMFEVKEESEPILDDKGFKVLDNKLDTGTPVKTYSMDEISKLTTEEINNNWDAVSASLERGED